MKKVKKEFSYKILLITLLASVAVFFSVLLLPTGYFVATPGEAYPVSVFMIGQPSPNTGGFYMTDVILHGNSMIARIFKTPDINANVVTLLGGVFQKDAFIGKISDYFGRGIDNKQYLIQQKKETKESNELSVRIALEYLGLPENTPIPFTINMSDQGESGSLMLSLESISRLEGKDLTYGKKVAGAGILATDHSIKPVGAISLKIKTAERTGMDYFLIPQENMEDIDVKDYTITIVPVATVEDAMAFLESS